MRAELLSFAKEKLRLRTGTDRSLQRDFKGVRLRFRWPSESHVASALYRL